MTQPGPGPAAGGRAHAAEPPAARPAKAARTAGKTGPSSSTPAAEAATNIIIQLVDEEGVAIGE